MTPHPIVAEARRLRRARRVTAKDIADRAGVSVNTISNWETGTNTASVAGLDAYLRAFGMRLAILPADATVWLVAVEVDAEGQPQCARLMPGVQT